MVELFQGIQALLKSMSNNGSLEYRRLLRYRERVLSLIRHNLENDFWNTDKINQLNQATKSLDKIALPPHLMAKKLLQKQ